MNARLTRTLRKLAAEKAPQLLSQVEQHSGDQIERIQWMARQLAHYRQVVLVGTLAQHHANVDLHVQDWLRGFGQFCTMLTSSLYPTYRDITARYADNTTNPWIVVLELESEQVADALAGTIVPFLAWRQPRRPYSEPELIGLMDIVLRHVLAVRNLDMDTHYHLQAQGVEQLKRMLSVEMRYVSLTTFDRPIVNLLPPQTSPPPVMLPEEQALHERQLTQQLELVEFQETDTTPSEEMFRPVPPITGLNKASDELRPAQQPAQRPAQQPVQQQAAPRRTPPVPDLPRFRNNR